MLEDENSAEYVDQENKSDFGRNVLKCTDIAWDNTENIDNIELPSFSESEDTDIDTLLQKGENLLQLECEGLDDFFACKTPELPKRNQPMSGSDRSQQIAERSVDNSVGVVNTERSKFPQSDPSPLISFTP